MFALVLRAWWIEDVTGRLLIDMFGIIPDSRTPLRYHHQSNHFSYHHTKTKIKIKDKEQDKDKDKDKRHYSRLSHTTEISSSEQPVFLASHKDKDKYKYKYKYKDIR